MKILIADDDPVSRTLLVEILSSAQAGYELVQVENGAQAWSAIEASPDIRLAITDIQMPVMNGIDWLGRVRADPRFASLPVIVCTGNADRATVASAAARGVNDFLVKPFNRSTVLEKVWQLCRPAVVTAPVLREIPAARQRLEIDRDAHRELLAHFVRVADMWAADARRATEHAQVRALTIRATNLKQQLGALGAAAVALRFDQAEIALGAYKNKPLATKHDECIRKTHRLGDAIQPEIDRLREVLNTLG